jgi:hypothetical protein
MLAWPNWRQTPPIKKRVRICLALYELCPRQTMDCEFGMNAIKRSDAKLETLVPKDGN